MSSCCETLMLGHRLQGTRLTGAHLRGLMIICMFSVKMGMTI